MDKKKKKQYSKPRLVVYGNLKKLTQAKGGTMTDGEWPASTKN